MRRHLLRAVLLSCAIAVLAAPPASAGLETIVQDDAVMLYSEPD